MIDPVFAPTMVEKRDIFDSLLPLLLGPIAVRDVTPIGGGSQRTVFVHPHDPHLVVKVPHAEYIERRSGRYSWRWYKKYWRRRLRARHFIVFQREINEQLAVRAIEPKIPTHMQTIIGFAETDIGMGLVCKCVRSRDGLLAPTLKRLIHEGRFDERAKLHLETFFSWLVGSPLVVSDLNSGNVVYGYDDEKGEVFVLVDGIGDKNLLPLNSLSKRLNRRSKQRRIRRLRAEIASLMSLGNAARTLGVDQ